jgi:glucan 1,3-beta-glucosidase
VGLYVGIIKYMTKAIRGINLGGWLIAERWMTPDLFKGVESSGEYELVRQLGREEAARRLAQHRDTFINEQDIKWLKEHKFELVRVPVGYWLFEETDEYISGERYMERLLAWAKKHDIKVIIDFHGLQGSQNGKQHSGRRGVVQFFKKINRQKALQTLVYIVKTYGMHSSVIGIQVSNEPRWPGLGLTLLSYYRQAYKIIDSGCPASVKVIVSDGFKPRLMAWLLMLGRFGDRLVMDVHLYQVFSSKDHQKSVDDYLNIVNRVWRKLLHRLNTKVPVLVGEWSASTAAPLPDTSSVKRLYDTQEQVFRDTTWAYCYWSYKAPGLGIWGLASKPYLH